MKLTEGAADAVRKFDADVDAAHRMAQHAHPLYQQANPRCRECRGTGVVTYTDNPNAKFDYYTLGGRWSGAFGGADGNSCPVGRIPEDFVPFAILTPEGRWYERPPGSSALPVFDELIW